MNIYPLYFQGFSKVVTHGLGYELNTARVHRRIHDYIKDLGED